MAANSNRGEIAFNVDGVEYIFKFGINAQAIIEDKTQMSIGKFLGQMQDNFGAKDIRLIFFAALAEHHNLSEVECGNLIDVMGAERASQLFLQAAQLAEAKSGKPNGAGVPDARPQKPTKERIGMNS